MWKSVQNEMDQMRAGLPAAELVKLLRHGAAFVRANAARHLRDAAPGDGSVIDALTAAANDPNNAIPLIGTVTVAHESIAALYVLGHRGRAVALRLIGGLGYPDRDDAVWLLKSEGLWVEEPSSNAVAVA